MFVFFTPCGMMHRQVSDSLVLDHSINYNLALLGPEPHAVYNTLSHWYSTNETEIRPNFWEDYIYCHVIYTIPHWDYWPGGLWYNSFLIKHVLISHQRCDADTRPGVRRGSFTAVWLFHQVDLPSLTPLIWRIHHHLTMALFPEHRSKLHWKSSGSIHGPTWVP